MNEVIAPGRDVGFDQHAEVVRAFQMFDVVSHFRLRIDLRFGVASGHVSAIGFGLEVVAGDGVGTGAAAAADMAVFAGAADAFVLVGVLEGFEDGVGLVGLDDGDIREAAADDGEEAGGEDLAIVADEHDATAIGDAEGRAVNAFAVTAVG